MYAIVLSPLIVLSLALVVEVGSLQLVKQRLTSAADMATVDAASQAADAGATGRIDADAAENATRQALVDNLTPLSAQIAGTAPDVVAANAHVYVVTTVPSPDPLRPGRILTVPTVEALLHVPVHSGMLAAAGLPNTLTMTIESSAAVREAGSA
jgi:hypothetical protein